MVSGQIDLKTGSEGGDPDEKAKHPKVTGLAKNILKGERWNGQKRQPHGRDGRSASVYRDEPGESDTGGVDIGAVETVVCVQGDENTQIVKAFENYTVDLQAIGKWLKEYQVKTGGDGEHRSVLDEPLDPGLSAKNFDNNPPFKLL